MRTDISGKTSLYNLFAELCDYIVSAHTKNYLVRYSCISQDEKYRVTQKIIQSIELKTDKSGNFKCLSESDLTAEFIEKLTLFADTLIIDDDKNCIMKLLQIFDCILQDILTAEIHALQLQSSSNILNTNESETGIGILPRCTCVWARKSRQSFSYRRIDNYMNNIIVIEQRILDNITAEHIFIPQGFFKSFDTSKKLKISATPLSSRSNFNIKFHKNSDFQVFTLDYIDKTSEHDNALVWSKILEAGRNKAEIIVFPEMLGNSSMGDYIRSKLRSLNKQETEDIPSLIVLPTYFADGKNFAIILDKYGNELARQYKQNPYVMRCKHGEYMENIIGSNQIEIFHYEGIGRFAIMICKDFLTTRYMERIMRGFMLTMIIVPAYSTGAYDFKMSFDLCAHDYCNVIWINSCAAMVPGKENNFEYIGYVRKRINRYQNELEANYKMKPCSKLLTGKCSEDCIYYDSFGSI